MTRDDGLFIEHIVDSIKAIERFTKDGKDIFLSSDLIQAAVIRQFEIIGEATRNLSDEIKAKYPEWRGAELRSSVISLFMSIGQLTMIVCGILLRTIYPC